MTNWQAIIEGWFERNHEEGSLFKVVRPGNSRAQIAAFELEIGRTLASQMLDLYLTADGFDLCENSTDEPSFVKPLSTITEYAEQECGLLMETHPDFAKQYVPFIDFGNGDSAGYVWVPDGSPVLVMIDHENYHYDSGQSVSEFITELDELKKFFLAL